MYTKVSLYTIFSFQASCKITLNTTAENGYEPGQRYRVAVTVQDSPRIDIKIGNTVISTGQKISKISVQVSLYSEGIHWTNNQ